MTLIELSIAEKMHCFFQTRSADRASRVTISHGRKGRLSFRCSIKKSAVVWENEERLRLNDRASCRDVFGRLFDLSYVTFS